jgi:hypothetical protein
MCEELTISIGMHLFIIIYNGGIRPTRDFRSDCETINLHVPQSFSRQNNSFPELPKETPTLVNLHEICGEENNNRDL